MNVHDLENFIKVSSFQSFSLAAKMMGITQPTLSESIKRLEIDIGKVLFYRSKNGISLTPDGQDCLQKAHNIINQINNLKNTEFQSYQIRLGSHATVGSYFLADFFKNVLKMYPHIKFTLNHARSRDIQTMVQNGEVDLGVIVNPIKNPDLIIKPICQDQVSIWQSKKSPHDTLIGDLDLIQSQSILRNWKKSVPKFIATSDFEVIARLVDEGIGLGILPERFIQSRGLKFMRHHGSPIYKDEICLVYRPEFNKTNLGRYIAESIIYSFKI